MNATSECQRVIKKQPKLLEESHGRYRNYILRSRKFNKRDNSKEQINSSINKNDFNSSREAQNIISNTNINDFNNYKPADIQINENPNFDLKTEGNIFDKNSLNPNKKKKNYAFDNLIQINYSSNINVPNNNLNHQEINNDSEQIFCKTLINPNIKEAIDRIQNNDQEMICDSYFQNNTESNLDIKNILNKDIINNEIMSENLIVSMDIEEREIPQFTTSINKFMIPSNVDSNMYGIKNNNIIQTINNNNFNNLCKQNNLNNLNENFKNPNDNNFYNKNLNSTYNLNSLIGNNQLIIKNKNPYFNEIIYNTNPERIYDYIDDILLHLKNIQFLNNPNAYFMNNQTDINEKMRGILIDWIVEVHLKFKLLPETLFITVNLIDRFLEKRNIMRTKLQLVGVTCLFIACKYEEIYPPVLKDFVYITDNAYSKQEIIEMEFEILSVLKFEITIPSSLRYLEIYNCYLLVDNISLMFCRYLLELFLLEYKMNKYNANLQACSSLYITFKITKKNEIDKLIKICEFNEDQLRECSKDICCILDNVEKSSLQAIKKKFSLPKFNEVAKIKLK